MERLYLEINFKDNDWYDAMQLVLPAIKATVIHYHDCLLYGEQKDIQGFYNCLRSLITAQLNLIAWYDEIAYDYAEDAKAIEFNLVQENEVKTHNNYETVYVQLFGNNEKSIGYYFFV